MGAGIRTRVLGESPPHRGRWPGRCPARVFSTLVGKPERGPKWQVSGLLGGTEGASFPEKAPDMSDWKQESDRRGHEHRMQMTAIPTPRPGHQPGSHPKAGRGREQKQTTRRPANTGPTFILVLPRGEGIQAQLASNQGATQVCPPPRCGQGVPNGRGRTRLKKQAQPAP